MRGLLRIFLAGWGARRLGGGCGCLGVIVVFIILYFLLRGVGI
ncbi:hypothetical protein BH24DEI1_BH24DEI1_12320 [soil metagenome]|jgi:hypothetical protein